MAEVEEGAMRHRGYGPLAVGLVVLIVLLASSAVPGHAGARVFVGVGVPFWYPYPYAYPYPVYAPPVAVQSPPPVYVQQESPAPSQTQYWYYCQSAQAYYPYVRECPGGWMQVVPQTGPAPQSPEAPR
jgi:hypothetical protein